MPLKDGIVALAAKGASDRLNCALLASVNVAVRTDTIARFLAELADKPQQRRTPNQPGRRAYHASSRLGNDVGNVAVENQPLVG